MRNPDTTTIALNVLHSVATLTALKIPGVHAASPRRGAPDGVHIQVTDQTVDVDIYLVLDKDVNLRQISRDVQVAVARAIEELVGMQTGDINVHIEDIYYPPIDGKD